MIVQYGYGYYNLVLWFVYVGMYGNYIKKQKVQWIINKINCRLSKMLEWFNGYKNA